MLLLPVVVTETLCCPRVAAGAIVNVAVIVVLLTTTTLDTVMPVPLTFTVAGDTRFVPVRVTGTDVLRDPADGLIEASVGSAWVVYSQPKLGEFAAPEILE